MEHITPQVTKPAELAARTGIGKLRARKKELKAELDSLASHDSTYGASETFEREKELCRELADVIPLIRIHNARKKASRAMADMAAATEAAVDTTLHLDPLFEPPVDITCCVTNCDSDCVTNCTSGCTLACDSDCRTGCTSGCTFGNNGDKTGSYSTLPPTTAQETRGLHQVLAEQVAIEWN